MKAEYISDFYGGTSNVVLPVRNKLAFPPDFQDKSRLCYYGSLFNSVEVNSTFYRLPMVATVAKWAADVPDNFRFTFKLWQQITHNKGFEFDRQDVHQFINVINQACNKNGCLLIQLPPGCQLNLYQLNNLLEEVRLADPIERWKIAVEFRNRSWYIDEVYALLDQYQATMVIHDLPVAVSPLRHGTAPLVYLRFHGPEGGYRGSYDEAYLSEYAEYIGEWLTGGKTVYVYFNNTMGDAVNNLITLKNMLIES